MDVFELSKVNIDGQPVPIQDGRLYVKPPGVTHGSWHIELYGVAQAGVSMLVDFITDKETASVEAFPRQGAGAFTGQAFVAQVEHDYVKLQGTGRLIGYD